MKLNEPASPAAAISVVPATPERWPDVATIFGGRGAEREGGDRGCWCQCWRASSGRPRIPVRLDLA